MGVSDQRTRRPLIDWMNEWLALKRLPRQLNHWSPHSVLFHIHFIAWYHSKELNTCGQVRVIIIAAQHQISIMSYRCRRRRRSCLPTHDHHQQQTGVRKVEEHWVTMISQVLEIKLESSNCALKDHHLSASCIRLLSVLALDGLSSNGDKSTFN